MLIVAYPRGVSTCVAQVLLNRLAEVLGGVRLDKIFKAAEVRTDHGKVYAKSYEVPKGCVSIRKLKPRRVSEAAVWVTGISWLATRWRPSWRSPR